MKTSKLLIVCLDTFLLAMDAGAVLAKPITKGAKGYDQIFETHQGAVSRRDQRLDEQLKCKASPDKWSVFEVRSILLG